MALKRYQYDGQGTVAVTLTVCPLCGHVFEEQESRPDHVGSHDPTDAGLSPLDDGTERETKRATAVAWGGP